MVSKRRRERRAKRDREVQSQQKMLMIGGGVILAGALIFFIIQALPKPQSERLPRANRVSAASLTLADGTDVCGQFPPYTGAETAPPAIVIDKAKDYSAWIVTDVGEIVVDLFANVAPSTVNNFMYLACGGFYDNLTFHRVVPGFVIQGGDPLGDGTGGPGYDIPDEFSLSDQTFDKPGLLSMAHSDAPNSAGSQFFITLADTPSTQGLSGAFTIFGETVKGMDVAQSITPRDPDDPATASNTPSLIQTIVVRQVSQ